MNKVICDICGTSYPDTAEQCPICGCSRELDGFLFGDTLEYEDEAAAGGRDRVKGGRFSTANVRKRNKNVNTYQASHVDRESFHDEEPAQESNTFLVVVLIILIVALLVVTGFLFVKFILPNSQQQAEDTTPSTLPTVTQTVPTTEEITEPPTVPCESILLISEESEDLVGIGQYYLVHVEIEPLDTTDEVVYSSSDESIAVINDEGRVEVVGEGTVTITVTCGSQQVSCTFNCIAEEETTGETTEETTEAAAESQPDITLFLDKDDFTLGFPGAYYRLKFNEELSAEDIVWTTSNGGVASVDNGLVTAVGKGVAVITAKYGDQEVTCVVRCTW